MHYIVTGNTVVALRETICMLSYVKVHDHQGMRIRRVSMKFITMLYNGTQIYS